MEHTQDSDCTIDQVTGMCIFCGVYHGAPCLDCGGRGFHTDDCLLEVRTFEEQPINDDPPKKAPTFTEFLADILLSPYVGRAGKA